MSVLDTAYQAEYGCDHVERLISHGRLQINVYKKHLHRAFETVDHFNTIKLSASSDIKAPVALPFDFICLECPETGSNKALDAHAKKAGHALSLHAHSRTLYCAACKDLVYDPAAEAIRLGQTDNTSAKSKKRKLSETNASDPFLTENTSQRECGQEGVRGLFNLGETCYMNSILQMMLHSQLLCTYFLGNGHPVHCCIEQNGYDAKTKDTADEAAAAAGAALAADENSASSADNNLPLARKPTVDHQPCISCGISDVFAESSLPEKTEPMKAVDLLFASWKAIPHMAGKGQQDAQEYYVMLVDKLHENAAAALNHNSSSSSSSSEGNSINNSNRSRCTCFFHKIFFGRSRSEITCDSCGTTSETEDAFSAISLDFQKQFRRGRGKNGKKEVIRLDNSHSSSNGGEVVGLQPDLHSALLAYISPERLGEEDYTCRGCEMPRSAQKRLRIVKVPALLCVHVKRFGGRMVGANWVEEKYEGRFEFGLSVDMGGYVGKGKRGAKGGGKEKEGGRNGEGELVYELSCVVVHHGQQIQNGHYLAYCRGGEGRWYRFDDEIVSVVTLEEVLGQEAYLLFYELRDMRVEQGEGGGVVNGSA